MAILENAIAKNINLGQSLACSSPGTAADSIMYGTAGFLVCTAVHGLPIQVVPPGKLEKKLDWRVTLAFSRIRYIRTS